MGGLCSVRDGAEEARCRLLDGVPVLRYVRRGFSWSLNHTSTTLFRDHSGFIDYNEFRSVMSASITPESIPFDFDWCVY